MQLMFWPRGIFRVNTNKTDAADVAGFWNKTETCPMSMTSAAVAWGELKRRWNEAATAQRDRG